MAKEVNLDEELQQAPEVPTFEIPMVRETPPGWSSYFTMEGETWYERALNFQKWSGHPPIPLEYAYDEDWNIVPMEEYLKTHRNGEKVEESETSEETEATDGSSE